MADFSGRAGRSPIWLARLIDGAPDTGPDEDADKVGMPFAGAKRRFAGRGRYHVIRERNRKFKRILYAVRDRGSQQLVGQVRGTDELPSLAIDLTRYADSDLLDLVSGSPARLQSLFGHVQEPAENVVAPLFRTSSLFCLRQDLPGVGVHHAGQNLGPTKINTERSRHCAPPPTRMFLSG
jgi:hypothetical protein